MKRVIKVIIALFLINTSFENTINVQANYDESRAVAIIAHATKTSQTYNYTYLGTTLYYTITVSGDYTITSGQITSTDMSANVDYTVNDSKFYVQVVNTITSFTSDTITSRVKVRFVYDGEELGMLTKTIKVIE